MHSTIVLPSLAVSHKYCVVPFSIVQLVYRVRNVVAQNPKKLKIIYGLPRRVRGTEFELEGK